MLRRRSPSPAELLLFTALLALLAAAVFGSHVINGGFLMDDWSNAAKARYEASCCGSGTLGVAPVTLPGVVDSLLRYGAVAYRPGLAVVVGITHSVLGKHMGYHLALVVLLGVLVSSALYALRRSIRLEPLHAGLISGLVLLFPFADAARMWASAGYDQLGVLLYLLGALVALRATRHAGSHAALLRRSPPR